MQYAAKLSPHGVISSGRGSSSAGLTVTAIKDGGQWALEAGALILSDGQWITMTAGQTACNSCHDTKRNNIFQAFVQPLTCKRAGEHAGGVCCIDEFDGIKEADKVSIHEVMEQQTLSIAKAGLVTSLSTRTSVFGAMNPRGNPKDSLAEQTLLSGPLLSRFDILLPVHDSKSSEADEVISEHILINHQLHRSSETKVGMPSIDHLAEALLNESYHQVTAQVNGMAAVVSQYCHLAHNELDTYMEISCPSRAACATHVYNMQCLFFAELGHEDHAAVLALGQSYFPS